MCLNFNKDNDITSIASNQNTFMNVGDVSENLYISNFPHKNTNSIPREITLMPKQCIRWNTGKLVTPT